MSRLKLHLLGPPRIELAESVLVFPRRKVLALLAYLAVTGRTHSRDALAELLYPRHDRAHARANLRQTIFHLQATLGEDWLIADRNGVCLSASDQLWVDVEAYRRLIREAGRSVEGATLLRRAAGLYRGEFLSGFFLRNSPAFEDWQLFQAEDLQQEQAAVLASLVEDHQLRGECPQALALCRSWLELDPLEEAAHRQLMRIHAHCGQWTAALRHYSRLRKLLEKELGESPDYETESLYAAIRRSSSHSGKLHSQEESTAPLRLARMGAAAQPRLRGSAAGVLPTAPLVGRETELAEICERLMDPAVSILTLTGPGGAGKTRLALQVVDRLSGRFTGGGVFVDLAGVLDPKAVVPAIATALRLREPTGWEHGLEDVLQTFLLSRRTLLLLDNFEQVKSAAGQIARILVAAPTCKTLVTSRESVHFPGDHLFPVPPLSLPDPGDGYPSVSRSEAARLFEARAAAVRPGFTLSEENAEEVAEICRRLDGLPLAIELSAARLRVLALGDLVSRLTDRLQLLRKESGDLPERQCNLKATLDWSYELLNPEEKRLFISLAVFSRGFSVDAAEQVCSNQDQPADLVEQLASLVDKSLLIREEVRKQARLRMLETIHEYCNWHFRESREVELIQERHAGYFLRFAERAAYELRGPQQMIWMERLEMENGNLQAAMDWSLAKNKIPEALRFGVALRWFWYRSGYLSYGRRYLQRALAVTPEAIVLRERALHALGWLEFVQGNWSQAGSLYREGLRLAHKLKDREGQCLLLSHLGVCERWLGQRKSGTAHVEQAVRMARRLVNSDLLGTALIWAYGTTGGRFEDRAPLAELVEAVDLCRRTGDLWGVSSALNGLGDLYRELGNWQQARPPYEEALAGFRELKDRWMTAWTLEGLGRAAQLAGEHRKAGRCFREALELFRLLGDRGNTAFMLNRLAFLARAQGNHNRAACLLAASANLQSSLLSPEAARRLQQETELAKATAEYKSAYAASWVRGQTMALELAIGFAKTTSKA